MKTPKCKHNVTLDSECADCIEIKTDNSQVLINQDKKIAGLEQKHRDSCTGWREAFDKMHQRAMKAERSCKLMGIEMDEFTGNILIIGGEIKGLKQKLNEQIAYSADLHNALSTYRDKVPIGNQPHMMAQKVDVLLNQSPHQSLKQVKADAIREMLDAVVSYDETSIGDIAYSFDSLSDYANQLLNKGE